MRAIDVLRTAGPVDVKNVRRDNFLAWIVGLPFLMALLLRYGIPALAAWLQTAFAFDLAPYYVLIMSTFVVAAPAMVGMVTGFLLLDERDDDVLKALLVTPMPFGAYLLYRIVVPLAIGLPVTLAGYIIAGLAPLPFAELLLITLLGSFSAPITALFLAVVAENKVSGFAIVKLLNTINMLPALAYFIGMPWQLLVGIVPGYWPLKLVWLAEAGQPLAAVAIAGFVVNALMILLLLRAFNANIRR